MLRRVSTAAAAAVVVAASSMVLLVVNNNAAWADCPPDPLDERGVCLSATVPSHPPTNDPGPKQPGPTGSACPGAPNGDCVNDYGGVWIGPPRDCYGFKLDPQPPAGDPLWGGHDPSKGSIWGCSSGIGPAGALTDYWFVPNGAAVVDPGAVAQQLVKRAPFELANAHMAPSPDYHTYINYVNWLWIPKGQWHDVSVSLTVAGATVTLTAKPTSARWDMGNGEGTSCAGPGRAWVHGMPEDAPTNCSFQYSTMHDPEGDTWAVSARINYTVGWTCTGNCAGQTSGDLGHVTALAGNPTSITVLQRQTVVTH
jgi:hypothetical protein